jgi:hypothetical protein
MSAHVDICGLIIGVVVTALSVAMTGTLVTSLTNFLKNQRSMKMSDLIAQIDIEIEACERAIRDSYSTMEVEKLTAMVQGLIKKRFVAYSLKEHENE